MEDDFSVCKIIEATWVLGYLGLVRCGMEKVKSMDSDQLEQVGGHRRNPFLPFMAHAVCRNEASPS